MGMSIFKKNNSKKKMAEAKKPDAVVPDIKDDKYKIHQKGENKIGGLGMKAKELREAHKVIMYPIVSEKGAHLSAQSQFVFAVNSSATKVKIRQAIFEMYGVYPRHINIVNQHNKKVLRGRIKGLRRRPTKAYVTMPHGITLNIYAGV